MAKRYGKPRGPDAPAWVKHGEPTAVFEQPEDESVSRFAAMWAAVAWLEERGYSVGPQQRGAPRAAYKGDALVSKWRNLRAKDIDDLDAVIVDRGACVKVYVRSARG